MQRILLILAASATLLVAHAQPITTNLPIEKRVIQQADPQRKMADALRDGNKEAFAAALEEARAEATSGDNNLRILVAMLDVSASPIWPEVRETMLRTPSPEIKQALENVDDTSRRMSPKADLPEALVWIEILLREKQIVSPTTGEEEKMKRLEEVLTNVKRRIEKQIGEDYAEKAKASAVRLKKLKTTVQNRNLRLDQRLALEAESDAQSEPPANDNEKGK